MGRHVFKDHLMLLALALPAILYFFIFHYVPMFGIIMAFKDFKYHLGVLGSEWIGFANFEFFFSSNDAWRITRNTVGYSLLFIAVGTAGAAAIALLLYEVRSRLALKFYQTTMIFPTFLSWVLVGYITYTLFNPSLGLFNQLRDFFGQAPVDWYADPAYWPYILTAANLWKGVGLSSIIYYAALMGVDPELYEAARIDGAGKWQQTKAISIPSLVPVMTILTILAIGDVFRGDFGLFYQIPRDVGMLYSTTDIIDTYVFRGLRQGDLGITAAVGLFQSVVGLALILLVNAIVRRLRPENALF
ncbi:sugar ABC transporter permease [Paenibacillus sp. IB182496]|uniref:Sugar ABC transporter permease n=1 Tax=Paenibacillus sabuli TaxID=2772509 RepID=A0A927BWY4_9BACL|nr:ABC transporter permease subunit [Paenibacillus sabuli]MBD2847416.1 sugar ABC transporter permease [Paenibacillus sabuli]